MKNNKIILSLGSNIACRETKISEAIRRVELILSDCRVTSPYLTDPLSGNGSRYLNAVMIGESTLSLKELSSLFKEIEIEMGRNQTARDNGQVPIDIDIVVFNDSVIRERDYSSFFFSHGLSALKQNS